MTLNEARRRFRTTLEIAATDPHGTNRVQSPYGSSNAGSSPAATDPLPPFWEDQLFAHSETNVVRFRIGDVAFEGSNPCARCPVPARESQTGVDTMGFQKRFSGLRRAQLPPWAPPDRFDT